MELSKRLYAVASLVTEGASVADIGTDHGYIPIYLVEHGISPKVIALDINKGPLERAKIHIASYGFSDKIETRLSDGMARVEPGEVEVMVAAGMGGGLVIHILEEGTKVVEKLKACILQPQSEIEKVRRYVVSHGLRIAEEDMVEEDGKYYPMMKVVHGQDDQYEEWEYIYGKRLLENQHPLLWKYLNREIQMKESILKDLSRRDGERLKARVQELEREMELARKAMKCFK